MLYDLVQYRGIPDYELVWRQVGYEFTSLVVKSKHRKDKEGRVTNHAEFPSARYRQGTGCVQRLAVLQLNIK